MEFIAIKSKIKSIERFGNMILRHLLSLFIGYIISKAGFKAELSPFSLSFMAVTPDMPLSVISYYIGTFLGFITKEFSPYNFKYIIANTVMFLVILILGEKRYYKRAYSPVIPAVICLAAGSPFLFVETFTVYSFILLACESLLCGCVSYFIKFIFDAVKRRTLLDSRDIVSLNITLMIVVCALDNYYIFGSPLSFVFVSLLGYLTCYFFDSKTALLFNAPICAIPAVLHPTQGYYFLLLYMPCAVCVLVSKYSKRHIVAGYYLTYLTFIAFNISIAALSMALSPLLSAVVYMLLPKTKIADILCNYIRIKSDANETYTESGDEMCKKYNQISAELLRSMEGITVTPILDTEAENRIKRYLRNNRCRNIDITNYYNENGKQIITIACKASGMFSFESLKNKLQEVCDNEFAISCESQNEQDIFCKFEQTDKYKIECYALYKPKNGESICGDNAAAFKSPCGNYNMVLADGMGSGKDAYTKSNDTVTLIKKLLRSGVGIEQTVTTVNSSMEMFKDGIGFSTVDLCCISLNDATAEFVKCGAYKSYIVREGKLTTISAGGYPAGLDKDASFSKKTVKLTDGDMIVMMSDGVGAADEIIQATLLMKKHESIEKLTHELIDKAYKHTPKELDDDMTVLTARIIKRNVE